MECEIRSRIVQEMSRFFELAVRACSYTLTGAREGLVASLLGAEEAHRSTAANLDSGDEERKAFIGDLLQVVGFCSNKDTREEPSGHKLLRQLSGVQSDWHRLRVRAGGALRQPLPSISHRREAAA